MVARIGLARAAAREGLTRAAGFATRNPVTQTPRRRLERTPSVGGGRVPAMPLEGGIR
jgi:hypothetical protein